MVIPVSVMRVLLEVAVRFRSIPASQIPAKIMPTAAPEEKLYVPTIVLDTLNVTVSTVTQVLI